MLRAVGRRYPSFSASGSPLAGDYPPPAVTWERLSEGCGDQPWNRWECGMNIAASCLLATEGPWESANVQGIEKLLV